jgi:drug/metabolite transporter (DMT)-like permease
MSRTVITRQRSSAPLALTLAATGWGLSATLSAQAMAAGMPPIGLLVVQLLSATILVMAVLTHRGEVRALARVPMRHAIGGLIDPGLGFMFGKLGLMLTSVTTASVMGAIDPLLVILGAWWFLGDRLHRRLVGPMLLALLGAALAGFETGGGSTGLLGIVVLLGGSACAASYAIVTKKALDDVAPTLLAAMQHLAGLTLGVLALGVNSLIDPTVVHRTMSVGAGGWAWAITAGVVGMGAPYLVYLSGSAKLPVTVSEQFFHLIPVVSLVGAIAIGERPSMTQLAGAALVIGAVAVVAQRSHRLHSPGEQDVLWPLEPVAA